MADYTPAFFPGQLVTFDAGGTITGGDLVKVGAADMAVIRATTDADSVVGVAAHDAVNGDRVGVYIRGVVHRSVAVGAITRGDLVVADSSVAGGRVKTAAAEGGAYVQADANRNARALVGLALESIADTATGRVMFF